MGINTVGDLLEYFPFRHEDQGRPQTIDSLLLDTPATVIGAVESVRCAGCSATRRSTPASATVRANCW
jgi:RecG-like helicase